MEFKKCERPLSRVYEAMMHLSLKPNYSVLIFSHCLIPDFASLLTKSLSDSPCNQALSLHPLSLMYGNCDVRLTGKFSIHQWALCSALDLTASLISV